MRKLLLVLAATAVAMAAIAGTGTAKPTTDPTIAGIAVSNPDFSTLVSLAQAAGLVEALSSPSAKLTVFAPTNAAFTKLEAAIPGVTKALTNPANKGLLVQVLQHHALSGDVRAAAATDVARQNGSVDTLLGSDANGKLSLSLDGSSLKVADSAGFSKATVTAADIVASNGVVHVIDTVLVPKSVATALKTAGLIKSKTIVDVAAGNKNLSTLVTLVKAAGLVGALSDPNAQLTVFAPRNHAFAALEKAVPGVTKALTDPRNKKLLVAVLKYHVLGTKVGSADAVAAAQDKAKVPTLLGKNANGQIGLSLSGSKLRLSDSAGFNTATVTRVDIAADNGVVHIIDKVMVPKSIAKALTKAGLIG
ncbi:MAG: fasciclin domain-containing protein [Gaiella sp.]